MGNSALGLAVAGLCIATLLAPTARAASAPLSGTAGTGQGGSNDSGAAEGSATGTPDALQTVVVTAERRNEARSQIETETGASTYTVNQAALDAEPGGQNIPLNQVMLQLPDVVQDSFGQVHVRGDHNDLQFRLDGIIIPEGISVFGQMLDPRLISSMSMITGALPAEYGLDTAGIFDVTTNSGALQPGGYVSIYGGSFDTVQPAFAYGGTEGSFTYYVSGDMLQNNLGLEAPTPTTQALHDHTDQEHGFGFFEDILDPQDRIALIVGTSDAEYQIPDEEGLQPPLGLEVNGVTAYPSNDLNENQHELTEYATLTWQHSDGPLNIENSLTTRYASLEFEPDWTGDLLYNGIAQNAFKGDTELDWQTDSSYVLSDTHTLRFGFYLQHDASTSNTTSQVLPIDALGIQTSDIPLTVVENNDQSQEIESAYVQDEWKVLPAVTLNYGLRFDNYSAYSSGSQVSPRVNFVWQVLPDTTLHGGYSRYFTPPPFELVSSETFAKFANTTAVPPGTETEDTAPMAERSDYYDLGVQQKLLEEALTLGIDAYGETSQNLIDEGQFGAPIILTPFNYRYGRIGGVEFTENYAIHDFSVYGNLAFQSAKGKDVESSQFNFTQQELAYIADNYIHLDHEERVSASAGASYLWRGTRFSVDSIFGTGLRDDLVLPSGFDIPNGDHTPSYTTVNLGLTHSFELAGSGPLKLRFDVINLFNKIYEIRSGTGIGVFLPQYGETRGVFGGLEWDF